MFAVDQVGGTRRVAWRTGSLCHALQVTLGAMAIRPLLAGRRRLLAGHSCLAVPGRCTAHACCSLAAYLLIESSAGKRKPEFADHYSLLCRAHLRLQVHIGLFLCRLFGSSLLGWFAGRCAAAAGASAYGGAHAQGQTSDRGSTIRGIRPFEIVIRHP